MPRTPHLDPTTPANDGGNDVGIAPPPPNLTGTWLADDGGVYFLRQAGDELWWIGLGPAAEMFAGLHFSNVYRAHIDGSEITGEWSDVPRGTTANHGSMTLSSLGDTAIEQRLRRETATGGFSGRTWRRDWHARAPRPAAHLLTSTWKNVTVWFSDDNETLADNLRLVRDSTSVFGKITPGDDHFEKPVLVNRDAGVGLSYTSFICGDDGDDGGDGDVTFDFLVDRDQIAQWQPEFFSTMDSATRSDVAARMENYIEGEIIMFGRAATCQDEARESSPALFPGWAEPSGSSPLFDGRPIPVIVLPEGIGSNQPNFVADIKYGDPVRVTGVLVYDTGHDNKLEIHPVYSVDRITAAPLEDLSGTWADDVGNTYFLRHHLDENTIWGAGLSPLGGSALGQVFQGEFNPDEATLDVTVVDVSLGFGMTPHTPHLIPTSASGAAQVTFQLDEAQLLDTAVSTLTSGCFRLVRLYPAPAPGHDSGETSRPAES